MNLLLLETTCDETAAAVVTDRREVLSSVVASQDDLHARFGGVVPEIAARAHLERILPVIDEALHRAGLQLNEIHAVAVANTPGLAGSLLVGLMAAKTICLIQQIPLVAVNHLQAHVYACRLAAAQDVFPCVGLVISGGHTSLFRCRSPLDFHFLGGTIDDAAGEAFDKVALMLGLSYPGGPAIEHAAQHGNPTAFRFPRAFINESRLDFSFSGLKTAVRYTIEARWGTTRAGSPTVSIAEEAGTRSTAEEQFIADIAAGFQEAVIDCLLAKAFAALEQTQLHTLCIGGGVAANGRLRSRFQEEAELRGVEVHFAPPKLCTDNAAMCAIALERLRAGLTEPLDLDAFPTLPRPVGKE